MRAPLCFCAVLVLCAASASYGQWKELPATGSPQNRLPDRTTLAEQAGLGPLLTARLVDPKTNSRKHRAVVEVQVDGVQLVEPDAANHQPRADQAHLLYRLDNDPILNTTSRTWTFEHLASGPHLIRVALADNEKHELGKEQSLRLNVP